ncbi:MAG: DsrE family protein [Boseongicola sp.]
MSYLINSCFGPEDAERATVPFILANAAAGKGEARAFLTCGALNLVVRDGAEGVVAEGYTPVGTLIDEFVEKGGHIWVCKVCAAVMGITQDDLIDGAEIGGAPNTMAFLDDGAKVLM